MNFWKNGGVEVLVFFRFSFSSLTSAFVSAFFISPLPRFFSLSLSLSLSPPPLHSTQETSTVAKGQAYHLSKAMAEKEAWKVAEAKNLDLVTINPNFVLGPSLSASDGGSISGGDLKARVEGTAPSGSPIICDVRDVARAHVVAAEDPGAKGRYIVSQPGAVLPAAMAAAIRGAVRDAGFEKEAALLPEAEAPPEGETGKAKIDVSRTVNELGVVLRSPEETLRDAARSLIKLGVAVPASKVGGGGEARKE